MFTLKSRLCTLLILSTLLVTAAGFGPSAERPLSSQKEGFYPLQQMFFLKKIKPDVQRIGVIWKKGVPDQEAKLQSVRRAVASIQGKLFLAYVESAGDIGQQFRQLVRKHDVQAIWVVENDGIVDGAAPRQYLIENATKHGIPLLAPSADWVMAGAPIAVEKNGDDYRILLNEPAAAAASLSVPAEYEAQTKLIAAN